MENKTAKEKELGEIKRYIVPIYVDVIRRDNTDAPVLLMLLLSILPISLAPQVLQRIQGRCRRLSDAVRRVVTTCGGVRICFVSRSTSVIFLCCWKVHEIVRTDTIEAQLLARERCDAESTSAVAEAATSRLG